MTKKASKLQGMNFLQCYNSTNPINQQIHKPARRSNENPCLNADDSQVGRAVEQTELPESGCSRTLLVMHKEEMVDYGSDDFDDTGSQYEQPDLNHHQPLHDDRLEDGPPTLHSCSASLR
jgi:hypothetical protein